MSASSETAIVEAGRQRRPPARTTRTRLLVVAYDRIGTTMAGPGIRAWEMACALASVAEVTVAVEQPVDRTAPPGVTIETFHGDRQLRALVARADVVLVQGLAVRRFPCLKDCPALLIVDLYDPWVFENLELFGDRPHDEAEQLLQSDADVLNELIDQGDFFICASERQRDYWLGMLTSRGRINRAVRDDDEELRSLIDVVPYGCPAAPGAAGASLRGVHPRIPRDSFLVLWSGGVWPWFDPDTVLEAVALAAASEPRIRLYVMGASSEPGRPPSAFARRVAEQVQAHPSLREHVILGEWVPYDDRYAVLHDADVAVIATRGGAETRLAFRSRVLDHLWAGLPTITTPGCVLSELLERQQAGFTTPVSDIEALAALLLRLACDAEALDQASAAAVTLSKSFAWCDNVAPIRDVVTAPERWHALRARRPQPWVVSQGAPRASFAGRGAFIEGLKRTRFYPAMRKVRRSRVGLAIWGRVPGAD